jgi:hypothetical protein
LLSVYRINCQPNNLPLPGFAGLTNIVLQKAKINPITTAIMMTSADIRQSFLDFLNQKAMK